MKIEYHQNTAGSCLIYFAREYSNRIAISSYDDYRCCRYTYSELLRYTVQTAGYLLENGCNKGDNIMICSENNVEYTLLIFSAALLGLRIVPVDINTSLENLENFYDASSPKFVFTSRNDMLEKFTTKEAKIVNIDFLLEDISSFTNDINEWTSKYENKNYYIDENDAYIFIFTSGTTSEPKIVQLTHRNLISNIQNFRHLVFVPENHRMLTMAPLSHVMGLTIGLYCFLSYGANLVYIKRLNSSNVIRVLHNDKIDAVLTVPIFLNILKDKIEEELERIGKLNAVRGAIKKMLKMPMWLRRIVFRKLLKKLGGDLKWIATGASALNIEVEEFWEAIGIQIIQGYGLTESLMVSLNDFAWRKMGTVGRSLPNQYIRLDENNEIWLAGPHVFKGYKNQEKINSFIFKDGWFRTGDIGKIDEDGYISIVGRLKNVIIGPSGLNIYPEDIENIITKQPEVKDCIVVNLPPKDEELFLVALLIFHEHSAKNPNMQELLDRINKQVSSHQKIAKIYVWHNDDFPRTSTKKIQRTKILEELKEIKAEIHSKEIKTIQSSKTDDSFEYQVRKIIASVRKKPIEEILNTHKLISDLGFDSITLVEMVIAIEEKLYLNVPQDNLFKTDITVEEFIELIKSGYKKGEDQEPTIKLSVFMKATLAFNRVILDILFPTFYRFIFKLEIQNKKLRNKGVIPAMKRKGHLIIANHNSHLDGVSIYNSFPRSIRKKIVMAAAHDYFYNPASKLPHYLLQSFIRAFPLKRSGNPREYFKKIGEILDNGDSVVIFPEGTRSKTGKLNPFLPSIGQLIHILNVPVVQLFLYGTYDLWPPQNKKPKLGKIKIAFNKPVSFSKRIGPYEIRDKLFEIYKSEFDQH